MSSPIHASPGAQSDAQIPIQNIHHPVAQIEDNHDLMLPVDDDAPPEDNVMQVGFVEIFEPPIYPVFVARSGSFQQALPADFFRLWAQHLAPSTSSSSVKVPPEWTAFFTAAVMNPCTFDWAKRFLTSPVWSSLQNIQTQGNEITFTLPQNCPVTTSPSCLQGSGADAISVVEEAMSAEFQWDVTDNAEDTELTASLPDATPIPSSPVDVNLDEVSPSTGPWAASLLARVGKLKLVEDDSLLRRSSRQKAQKKGFRHKSCIDSHCVACASAPPTFSPSLIRNLGATFCDIDPTQLTDQALSKKKKVSAPGGKKKTIKKKPNGSDEEQAKDAAPKKKSKK